MSYSGSNISYSDPQEPATTAGNTSGTNGCCSTASSELKLYQAFIFAVPIFFTLMLLFVFYLFYLRRGRVNWSSMRIRTSSSAFDSSESDESVRAELGLRKEVREMLPIIVFAESFSIKDTQCSVCLGDYQAEERLQQIPACGHTFHMNCIDSWLATHATCPLCRQSLLTSAKASSEAPNDQAESNDIDRSSNAQNGGEMCPEHGSLHCEDNSQQHDESQNVIERTLTTLREEEETESHDVVTDRETMREVEC